MYCSSKLNFLAFYFLSESEPDVPTDGGYDEVTTSTITTPPTTTTTTASSSTTTTTTPFLLMTTEQDVMTTEGGEMPPEEQTTVTTTTTTATGTTLQQTTTLVNDGETQPSETPLSTTITTETPTTTEDTSELRFTNAFDMTLPFLCTFGPSLVRFEACGFTNDEANEGRSSWIQHMYGTSTQGTGPPASGYTERGKNLSVAWIKRLPTT